MRITVYAYDDEDEYGSFGLNVKDPITDDEVREHVDCFVDNWTGVHFHNQEKRIVLPKD